MEQQVEPLHINEEIITDSKDIEEVMFETFFAARHITDNIQNFDDFFYKQVCDLYDSIKQDSFAPNPSGPSNAAICDQILNTPITLDEITSTIKGNKSAASSFDNCSFHQSMFTHLGDNALNALLTLFNLCLTSGEWAWKNAKVIFLKKNDKGTYAKPGSYRPISITSYIGKLLEKILASRLDEFLIRIGIVDPSQEGFFRGRNTVRYLNKLTTGVKGDLQKKLTVFCLFLDFEKAFDSTWKEGLLVKLWKVGVHGLYLQLLDNFLVTRSVSLLINGLVGGIRLCGGYGLPQGSAISPVLFRFYVYDLGMDLEQIRNIKFYKFADDGTAKVSASTLEECLDLINLVLESICEWTRIWRMVVNCNRNKTELICFNKIQLTQDFLLLGQNKIFFTDSSKVLGVTIDKRLDFKDHSKDVYNRLLGKWVMMSKYSSRNWGMNQEVTVRILKTIMFSSLFYGSMVWMKEDNTRELNGLIYKMSKSALGAVFHVSQVNTEVILGLPPFWIVNKVNSVKHYLKLIGNQPEAYKDSLILYIQEEITLKKNSTIVSQIKEVFQYLKWKLEVAPGDLSELDKDIVYRSDIDRFQDLSMEGCKYSRSIMTKYTEKLWQQSVNNRLQLEGETRYPIVNCSPLKVPYGTTREEEVKIISLFYKNNLLSGFLYKVQRELCPSPMCACGTAEQSAFHIAVDCPLSQEDKIEEILALLAKANSDNLVKDEITLLNCSRQPAFVAHCLKVARCSKLNLRTNIILLKPTRSADNGDPQPSKS